MWECRQGGYRLLDESRACSLRRERRWETLCSPLRLALRCNPEYLSFGERIVPGNAPRCRNSKGRISLLQST